MRSTIEEVTSLVVEALYNEDVPLSLSEISDKIDFRNTLSSLRYFIQKMVKNGVLIPIEDNDEHVVYDLQEFFKRKDEQKDIVLQLLDSVSDGILPCIACANPSKTTNNICDTCDEKKKIVVLKNCLHAYIDIVIDEEMKKIFM